ncbi:hypothetical protein [Streptomyces sp. NPDC050738]
MRLGKALATGIAEERPMEVEQVDELPESGDLALPEPEPAEVTAAR